MNLALWILAVLVALNGFVVLCGWRAAKKGNVFSPPPGSPRARHMKGQGR